MTLTGFWSSNPTALWQGKPFKGLPYAFNRLVYAQWVNFDVENNCTHACPSTRDYSKMCVVQRCSKHVLYLISVNTVSAIDIAGVQNNFKKCPW